MPALNISCNLNSLANFNVFFFISCSVNDLQIITVPTNAQFYYYVFRSYMFRHNCHIRQLTFLLLKLTATKYSYIAYTHPIYGLQFKILTIICQLNLVHTLQSCSFKTHFNIILPITSKNAYVFEMVSFHQVFVLRFCTQFASLPFHPNLLHLIIFIIIGEE
jgi:hypothetical protein